MLNLIMKDVLGTPAILVGLFALLGLVLQKKGLTEVVSGTLKTIMGFIILGVGANVLVGTLNSFGAMFEHAFHIKGIIPNNEVVVAIAQKAFGKTTAMIMLLGMLVNILIARFTRFKYIFLTGHHTMYMACMLAVILATFGIGEIQTILLGAVILGVVMALFPAMLQPFTKKITDSDDFALGHFNSIGYLASALVGKYLGNSEKTTEELKVPKSLGFLRDSSVSLAITMTILFVVVGSYAGSNFVETKLSDGQNFVVYAFMQAIAFAGGVYVILAGVRMLLAEIVPAFKGIADKIVPNAIPALDCPIVFPFAPNAVIIGFFSSFIAGLVCMFIFPQFGWLVIVPGLVPHFFDGATAGVYGNATGGRRGAVLGAFVNGIIISLLPVLLFLILGGMGFQGSTFGDSDFGFIGVILGKLGGIIFH
jgi:PTS system ascorbate-specific IIC component